MHWDASQHFSCREGRLQALWEKALFASRENLRFFNHRKVLVEGGGYEKIWLETQPMGGEMYFPHDGEAGVNNLLLFMEHQRADGRLPGSIALMDGQITPQFNKLQGFCFPLHAMNLYYLTGEDKAFLKQLEDCLMRFDAWLWRTRDSDGDGILESFCVYDTGEDNALRYGDAPCWWEEDAAPEGNLFVPMASMDIMSFSYSCRNTLARISRLLQNGKEMDWQEKARDVQNALKAHLWDAKKAACFDRYPGGKRQKTLTHNNLRCMYWESFTDEMAQAFVKRHLLNPREFFTPFPLPSVAADDPLFRNIPENNWSGQSEGLTWQRLLFALENYGMERLLPPLAEKLFAAVEQNGYAFTQQYDPFTGMASLKETQAAYGPTILSVIGYITHLYGIFPHKGDLRFSAMQGLEYTFTYHLNGEWHQIESDGKMAHITFRGHPLPPLPCGYSYTFRPDFSIKTKHAFT